MSTPAEELWDLFQSRRFLHGHREGPKTSFMIVSKQSQVEEIAQMLRKGFLTCVAGDGKQYVKIDFSTLSSAQELYNALATLASKDSAP